MCRGLVSCTNFKVAQNSNISVRSLGSNAHFSASKRYNEIKNAKRKYFTDNLESSKSNPKKTWQLMNCLRDFQIK